jgi:hypothetical protein
MGGDQVTPNILDAIAGLCESRYEHDWQRQEQLRNIRELARRNTKMLSDILHDYIRQNEEDPTYRKARLKAAKPMLGDFT